VQWADDLAGPHDVIARVQASGLDELGRLVVARIQAVDGVTARLVKIAGGLISGTAPGLLD
jgi:hypothetical protein